MPDLSANPCDLLATTAARIRWQQRLLCALPLDCQMDVGSQEAQGLYYVFEDIYQHITEAVQLLDAQAKTTR